MIHSIITLLIFIYAVYIFPKAMGEIQGVYKETPDEFFGKFEEDCKWTHGTTYTWGAISYVLIVVLLVIWEQINNIMGIILANAVLLVIVILFKIYYDKKGKINEEIAYQKNMEDGYIKKSDKKRNMKK